MGWKGDHHDRVSTSQKESFRLQHFFTLIILIMMFMRPFCFEGSLVNRRVRERRVGDWSFWSGLSGGASDDDVPRNEDYQMAEENIPSVLAFIT